MPRPFPRSNVARVRRCVRRWNAPRTPKRICAVRPGPNRSAHAGHIVSPKARLRSFPFVFLSIYRHFRHYQHFTPKNTEKSFHDPAEKESRASLLTVGQGGQFELRCTPFVCRKRCLEPLPEIMSMWTGRCGTIGSRVGIFDVFPMTDATCFRNDSTTKKGIDITKNSGKQHGSGIPGTEMCIETS